MFPAERLTRIKDILTDKKQIDISFLSNTLNVTEVTIRRDLEKLESEGFLMRTHGGAVLAENGNGSSSTTFFEMDRDTEASLRTLGELSSFFINDNDVIFLGPGVSNRFFFYAVKEKRNLTVVTNDLAVTLFMSVHAPEVRIICPSGEVNTGDFQLYGRVGESVLSSMYFNTAFIDVDGVSLERGYTVSSMDKAYLIHDIQKSAGRSIAICDYTKFGQNSFVPLGQLDLFKTIISNEQTPKEYKEYYFRNNIQLFCTFDAYDG